MESTTEAKAPTAQGDKDGDTPPVTATRESLYSSDNTDLRAKAREEIERNEQVEDIGLQQDEDFNPFEQSTEEVATAPEETPVEEEAEPEKVEEEQEEEDTEKPAAKRIRMKVDHLSAQDRAITELMGRKGLSMAEAYEEITGQPLGAPQAKAPQTESVKEEVPDAIAAQVKKIEDIEAALEQAGKDFKSDEQAKLTSQLMKESRVLIKLENEAANSAREKQNQQQSRYDSEVNASVERSVGLFPDLVKEGTPLCDAVNADAERLKVTNPAFFNDPEWPELLAAKHALRLKISPAGTKPPEKAPVSPKKPLARTTVPTPEGSAPEAVQNKPVSAEEQRKQLWDPNTPIAETRKIFKDRKETSGVKSWAPS